MLGQTWKPHQPDQIDHRLVVVDVETSGLHPDDGAYLAVVSLAYTVDGEMHSVALPIDQGHHPDKYAWWDQYRPSVEHKTDRKQAGGQGAMFAGEGYAGGYHRIGLDDWQQLTDWLTQVRLAGHNLKFDLLHLWNGPRFADGIDMLTYRWDVWDTAIAQRTLDPRHEAGLKETMMRLDPQRGAQLKLAEEELQRHLHTKDDPRYDLVPWPVMEPYARMDAECTLWLWHHQQDRLATVDAQHRHHLDIKMQVAKALLGCEVQGIGFDWAAAKQAAREAGDVQADLASQLPFNPTPQGAAKHFYTQGGARPHCVTEKGGNPSAKECCIRELVLESVPYADIYAKYVKTKGARERWYEGFADAVGRDGRLRTVFNQTGTISGRFSSTRVNLQALPHDYRVDVGTGLVPPRSLFRPRPGYQLWEMDLSQAELRLSSKVAGCKTMQEAIGRGDPHGDTARALFSTDPTQPRWFEYRQLSKRANFALVYRVSAPTFRADVEKQVGLKIPLDEATQIVTSWNDLYPEFRSANYKYERLAKQRGYVTIPGGTQRWFRAYESEHKAFNAVIQGGIAWAMQLAMLEVDRMVPRAILLQIHDSLVLELPESEGADLAQACSDRMAVIATRLFETEMVSEVKQWK